jgi:hypothetical protein
MPTLEENIKALELAIRIAETKPNNISKSVSETADDIINAAEKIKKFFKTPA